MHRRIDEGQGRTGGVAPALLGVHPVPDREHVAALAQRPRREGLGLPGHRARLDPFLEQQAVVQIHLPDHDLLGLAAGEGDVQLRGRVPRQAGHVELEALVLVLADVRGDPLQPGGILRGEGDEPGRTEDVHLPAQAGRRGVPSGGAAVIQPPAARRHRLARVLQQPDRLPGLQVEALGPHVQHQRRRRVHRVPAPPEHEHRDLLVPEERAQAGDAQARGVDPRPPQGVRRHRIEPRAGQAHEHERPRLSRAHQPLVPRPHPLVVLLRGGAAAHRSHLHVVQHEPAQHLQQERVLRLHPLRVARLHDRTPAERHAVARRPRDRKLPRRQGGPGRVIRIHVERNLQPHQPHGAELVHVVRADEGVRLRVTRPVGRLRVQRQPILRHPELGDEVPRPRNRGHLALRPGGHGHDHR